jgi:uncharacterized membrane protein YdjX (TVP38/TMEM64 family)
METKKNLILRYLPLGLIFLASLVAWRLGLHETLTLENLRLHQAQLETLVGQHLIVCVAVFSLTYILIVTLSLPVASFMTLLGGFLFGPFVGTGAVVFSATFGATLLFLSLRRVSQDLLRKRAGAWFQKMEAGFQENALSYLLTLRLIPLFPFAAINVVAAVLQVPLRTFFLGTFFGIIPGSFVYVLIGQALQKTLKTPGNALHLVVDPWILGALTGLGILALLPVLYKHFQKKRRRP